MDQKRGLTVKEVEHFLIENNFIYDKEDKSWAWKGKRPVVSDIWMTNNPEVCFEWIKEMLGESVIN